MFCIPFALSVILILLESDLHCISNRKWSITIISSAFACGYGGQASMKVANYPKIALKTVYVLNIAADKDYVGRMRVCRYGMCKLIHQNDSL